MKILKKIKYEVLKTIYDKKSNPIYFKSDIFAWQKFKTIKEIEKCYKENRKHIVDRYLSQREDIIEYHDIARAYKTLKGKALEINGAKTFIKGLEDYMIEDETEDNTNIYCSKSNHLIGYGKLTELPYELKRLKSEGLI